MDKRLHSVSVNSESDFLVVFRTQYDNEQETAVQHFYMDQTDYNTVSQIDPSLFLVSKLKHVQFQKWLTCIEIVVLLHFML